MKVLLPVLLAALLGVERVHSLVCFSCTNKNSNFYCLKPTICSDSDNYCVTVSASAGIGNVVDFGYTLNKGCSPICPGPSVNLGVASVGTHCCQSFLCNISAADGGLRASAAVLGLGLLLSLLSALLRFGMEDGLCGQACGPCALPGSSLPCRRSHLAASWADERLAAGHSVSSQFFLGPDRRPSALRSPEARPAVSKARGRVQGHEVRGPDKAQLPCRSESCNSAARPALPGGLSCKTRRSHPAAGSRGDLGMGTHRRKRSVLDLGPWMAKMLSKEDFQ